jgi:peptide-methionine (S)-S-oxide reductase
MMGTKLMLVFGTLFGLAALFAFARPGEQDPAPARAKVEIPEDAATLVLGAGCFWCVETIFEELKGVYDVENGYAGGFIPNPTYKQVSSGATGHAEVIRVSFDPNVVSAEDLLRLFFVVHDPTTLNRQGPDVGTQYRSAIFYADDEEKARAERIRDEIASEGIWKNPIVTTIEPLKNYARAEEYHQDYFARFERASAAERATMNAGYCSAVIEPKVRAFRQKFADRLKRN